MLILESFPCGPFATNAILVGCGDSKEGIFIDPAPESYDKLMEAAKTHLLQIKAIYLTHSHWDHIADVARLKKTLDVPVWIHQKDQGNLEHPGSDGLPLMIPIEGVKGDCLFEEKQQCFVGNILLEVIETPGHTPGGVSFYLPKENVLISGDTLFKGSIGSLSFPTANPSQMWTSLKKLATLPPNTKVYPGHGESTTIGAETWLERAEEIFG